jgi:hypothetical protein
LAELEELTALPEAYEAAMGRLRQVGRIKPSQ